jgi:outer membrane receptor protein involved in Fe transport
VRAWVAIIAPALAACLSATPARAAAPDETTSSPYDDDEDGKPASASAPALAVEVVGQRSLSRDASEDDTMVTGKRLRQSARASLFEALSQEAADVYVSGRGAGLHGVGNGATGAIHVRGLGGSPNSQVLVVEDGVPDYQGIFGHPIPDAYVPALLGEALVVKGGDSVLYGTNAMGGVIVLRSRWLDHDGYELGNDAAYGSYSTVRDVVSGLARAGGWDLAAAFNVLDTDGHRDGAGGSTVVAELAARYRFSSDLALTVRNKVVHLTGADPGPASHPLTDHGYDAWRDNASFRLEASAGPHRLSFVPYLNVGIHQLYDGFYSRDETAGAIGEADLALAPSLGLLLGLGVEQINAEVENRISAEQLPVRGSADLAFYSQLTWRPVEALSLVLGTRDLYSTRYGPELLYKGGVRWDVYQGLFLRSRLARNFRQPTIRELYLPFPTANPELRPEHALNWDFGGGYQSEHVRASCSGYRTEARDLIKYFGAWPAAEVVNIDHTVVWGLEADLGLAELGPLSLYLHGDWQDVGRYTRQNPSAKANATLEIGQGFGSHFVSGSVSGEWVHGLYMADYARQPIDDVLVVDASARYRYSFVDQGLSLEPYVLLRNLLDRRYAYVADYPMPGFNVLGGLEIRMATAPVADAGGKIEL